MPAAWDTFRPNLQPMTAADWLALYAASVESSYDDRSVQITSETTIEQWDDLMLNDFADRDAERRELERVFGAVIPVEPWLRLHENDSGTTLGELCALLATCDGMRPAIEPLQILGRPCREAGAFLTLRWALHHFGANVDNIAPSTPLGPVALAHRHQLRDALNLIEPRAHSCFRERLAWPQLAALTLFGLAIVAMSASVIAAFAWPRAADFGWWALAAMLCSWLLSWATSRLPPRHIDTGPLQTVGDLARHLASRSSQPKV